MTSVAVVTSCYGDYDHLLPPPEQTVECEWVAVLDRRQPDLVGWRQVVEPRDHLHPRMAAKVAKCRPDLYSQASVLIWLDAGAMILSSGFVEMCLDALAGHDVAQWVHPERSDIFDEAIVSVGMAKYAGQSVIEQAETYISSGRYARHSGLWATGCIAYNAWTPPVTGERWLAEQTRWTYQDQLSWPAVVADQDVRVGSFPQSLWANEWVSFRAHRSHL